MSETPSRPKDYWHRIPWIAFVLATVGYAGYFGSIVISGVAMGLGDDPHRKIHLMVRCAAGLLWLVGVALALLSLVVFVRRKKEEMKIPLIFASIPIVVFPLLGHLRML